MKIMLILSFVFVFYGIANCQDSTTLKTVIQSEWGMEVSSLEEDGFEMKSHLVFSSDSVVMTVISTGRKKGVVDYGYKNFEGKLDIFKLKLKKNKFNKKGGYLYGRLVGDKLEIVISEKKYVLSNEIFSNIDEVVLNYYR